MHPENDHPRDVAGYDLGAPLELVRPRDADEVRDLVLRARREHVPLVPFGRRTAYWRPLDLDGALAVDLASIDHVRIDEDVVVAGAGALVRRVDDLLRERGLMLPLIPDGYGDSTIGAMVATACTAGRGMGNGPFSRWTTGLTVVDGTAALFSTGAAAALSLPPFVRDGLPDLTGCFFGSEGCLGVVTEVFFRAVPLPHRVLLHFDFPVERTNELSELARLPRYDLFRARCSDGRMWSADLYVQSQVSADEAQTRAETLARELDVRPSPLPPSDWEGPPGGHDELARTQRLIGLDAVARLRDTATLAEQLLGFMARCPSATHRHVSLYFAPDYVCGGVHLMYRADDEAGPREAQTFTSELRDVVPYRFGRVWPVGDLQRRELLRLKAFFDPDRILNPTHPLFK